MQIRHFFTIVLFAVLVPIFNVFAEVVPTASQTQFFPKVRAENLVGLKIPASYFTEKTNGGEVISAKLETSATNSECQYVNVFGYIYSVDPTAPNIEWRILLPLRWNGRTVQYGGGANNGNIPKIAGTAGLGAGVPVDEGYVVYGDDSGHQSKSSMDASFASNAESLANYGRLHLIKAQFAMKYIVEAFYGRKPVFNYFAGYSTGGREALECATTYGKYYDGVFCGEPASNFVLIRMWGAILSQAVYNSYDPVKYPYSDGFIDEPTVNAIQADAIARYDELDGIKDGIVSNIYAARMGRQDFLKEITQKYHLTPAQLKTIDIYENGYKLDYAMPNGMKSYHGYAALEGGQMDLGPDPVPREPLDTKYNVHHGDRADGVFKYFITKDPTWVLIKHDYYHPDQKLHQMLMDASRQYDANRPNFDQFIQHDGKLIYFAGWNDMSMSPWQLIQQYKGYVNKYGQKKVDSFCKFYLMPGVTHGNGIKMDYLSWLDEWRSTGKYPTKTLYATMKKTGGQMPMAAFPGWVQYVGGNPLNGDSYKVNNNVPVNFWKNFD